LILFYHLIEYKPGLHFCSSFSHI